MRFRHGVTVFRDRPVAVPDPYRPERTIPGSFDGTEDTVTIDRAFVAASSSSAVSSATRSQVLTSKSLYCTDPNVDVRVGDRIRVGDDTYFVNEVPSADANPFTGWQPVKEIPLDGSAG